MLSPTTLVIADDHLVIREGVVNILRQVSGIQIVGEASDGEQALKLCEALRPHLLLLDLRLPKIDGLTVTHCLAQSHYAPRILMFSAFASHAIVEAALDAGANGYILKTVSKVSLTHAIRRTMQGQQVLIGVEKLQKQVSPMLSRQELVVLNYAAKGIPTRDIALYMNCSTKTVDTYFTRVFCKLDVNTRAQAVAVAFREQWLPLDEEPTKS